MNLTPLNSNKIQRKTQSSIDKTKRGVLMIKTMAKIRKDKYFVSRDYESISLNSLPFSGIVEDF